MPQAPQTLHSLSPGPIMRFVRGACPGENPQVMAASGTMPPVSACSPPIETHSHASGCRMPYRLVAVVACITGCLFFTATCRSEVVTFTRLIDTSVQVPNQDFQFNSFSEMVADGSDHYFIGARTGPDVPTYAGIFRLRNGVVSKIVDTDTEIPGDVSGRSFSFFDGVSARDGEVVFIGRDPFFVNQIFRYGTDGSLTREPDNSTRTFRNVNRVATTPSGEIRFWGGVSNGDNSEDGVYRLEGGTRTAVANATTPIPDGTGTFDAPSFSPISTSGFDRDGRFAFRGTGSDGQEGIYSDRSGTLEKVINVTDIPAGQSEPFVGFAFPEINGDSIGFLTGNVSGVFGIFHIDADGNLSDMVNNQTLVPGTDQPFTQFGWHTLDESFAVFHGAADDGQTSLYYTDGDEVGTVALVGDEIDGQIVDFIGSPTAIGNGEFLVPLRFTDSPFFARYQFRLATAIPEPATWAVLGVCAVGFTMRRVARRRRPSVAHSKADRCKQAGLADMQASTDRTRPAS